MPMLRHVYGLSPADVDDMDMTELSPLVEWGHEHLGRMYGRAAQ